MEVDRVEIQPNLHGVGVGAAVGGTIALVSVVMQKWLGKQRQIYMEIGLPLSVVAGILSGALTCAKKPQQQIETPPKTVQVPLDPSQKRTRRNLFGTGKPSPLPPPNYQLSFYSPKKPLEQPSAPDSCSIF
ncbi:MAG: hypothetical protein JSR80_02790 [Verrucomicrobia bacterium]|nr:hypothetical protein [Verrucomicrobiota bacterium]